MNEQKSKWQVIASSSSGFTRIEDYFYTTSENAALILFIQAYGRSFGRDESITFRVNQIIPKHKLVCTSAN